MISGGLAGGSMTEDEMLDEYLKQIKEGLAGMLIAYIIFATIMFLMPAGCAVYVFLAVKIYGMYDDLKTYYQMIGYLEQYLKTGDFTYLQKMEIDLAAMLTLNLFSKAGDTVFAGLGALRQHIDDLGKKKPIKDFGCFIAGTLVFTSVGLMPIESVAAGDLVKSFDPDTGIVSEQLVEETFIKESSELVHVKTGTETITATTNHPFYVPQKGFVEAIHLRAGDRLQTVNGEYMIVEQVQHEILEAPVKVYNFHVANNHTYYVGENVVGVHNDSGGKNKPDIDFPSGEGGSGSWDMPEGGGVINGREYSQHALERMAPDTPSVRAELSRRAEKLAEKLGYKAGTKEYNDFCVKYVDPRNIPPSVVEDAISSTKAVPGDRPNTFNHETADVKIVINSRGKVITVIPK